MLAFKALFYRSVKIAKRFPRVLSAVMQEEFNLRTFHRTNTDLRTAPARLGVILGRTFGETNFFQKLWKTHKSESYSRTKLNFILFNGCEVGMLVKAFVYI